ncbi:MAG: TRAP transporter substrate-binding protein [Megasphaera massiliensis]|uniref:TRAP transporter substrate-binding protein n=1 Tax=Megasphaera massiliensis TaxID=1232428 RepID=UPI002A765EE8|nr:TRAP transporter substrate-binding protein [Megasphaera massiliensis]MDY2965365.1 TRAP transporter substrate-binding protein [Megasphaera massiliensis]
MYDADGVAHLRLAQASASDGAIGKSLEIFAKDVYDKSNGRIQISVFHNGQLGSERDNIEACELGNLDIAVVNQSVLANFIPEIAVFDLPYTIESEKHADAVFLGPIGKDFLQRLSSVKLHGLGIWESGFRDLTNSKRPVVNVDDVYGLRVRVMENKIHQELWKALGADPVPMSWGDAYTGLQQGALDGQENPPTVIDKNNVVEVNKNMAITQHVYSTVFLIMSPQTWEGLTPEDQQLITECMNRANLDERRLSRQMDKEALDTLASKGMKITYPNKEQFIAATQGVREEFSGAFTDTLNRIKQTAVDIKEGE